MKREFHAQYNLALQPGHAQQEAIDFLTANVMQPPKTWKDIEEVADPFARVQLMAQAILTHYKNYARVGAGRSNRAGLLHAAGSLKQFLERQYNTFFEPLKLHPGLHLDLPNDLTSLPRGTWVINFRFELRRPYLSKDDTDFYIIDNPVKKDWVFKLPYVAPSQWKGALRFAMVRHLVEWWSDLDYNGKQNDSNLEKFVDRRIQMTRLFGNEKEVALDDKTLDTYLDKKGGKDLAEKYRERLKSMTDTGFFAGQLRFYPTYFTEIDMEVINPHDRETGTGKQPIYFECVPAGADGTFALLYVPIGGIGEREAETEEQSADDLDRVARGITAILTEYGFGAKTSSGFGRTETCVENGGVCLKAEEICFAKSRGSEPVIQAPDEAFKKYLDEDYTVREEFCGNDGKPLSSKKYRTTKPPGGGSLTEFKNFKRWHDVYGESWRIHLQADFAPCEYSSYDFKDLVELKNVGASLVKREKKEVVEATNWQKT